MSSSNPASVISLAQDEDGCFDDDTDDGNDNMMKMTIVEKEEKIRGDIMTTTTSRHDYGDDTLGMNRGDRERERERERERAYTHAYLWFVLFLNNKKLLQKLRVNGDYGHVHNGPHRLGLVLDSLSGVSVAGSACGRTGQNGTP